MAKVGSKGISCGYKNVNRLILVDVDDENLSVRIADLKVHALTPTIATKYGLLAAACVAFLESDSKLTKARYSSTQADP
jgi:hypothetical protein